MAGSEALVFVEYRDTHIYVDRAAARWPSAPEVSTSAGALADISGEEFYSLRTKHPSAGWIYRWQTPDTPQIVVVQASLRDGGKSIKVEVVAAD